MFYKTNSLDQPSVELKLTRTGNHPTWTELSLTKAWPDLNLTRSVPKLNNPFASSMPLYFAILCMMKRYWRWFVYDVIGQYLLSWNSIGDDLSMTYCRFAAISLFLNVGRCSLSAYIKMWTFPSCLVAWSFFYLLWVKLSLGAVYWGIMELYCIFFFLSALLGPPRAVTRAT